MRTEKGRGKGTERSGRSGRNGTGNGEREVPARSGRAVEEGDEKEYVGRGYIGVLGGLRGRGSQYDLGPTIFVMAGTAE